MDCKSFRKHHLAYLDDTLPGALMADAQRHVMACNGCAAHDTLVRRSLIVARNMPALEPSPEFQAKLRARLAACRTEDELAPLTPLGDRIADGGLGMRTSRRPRVLVAAAASAVIGVLAYQAYQMSRPPALSMQPVMASRPAPVSPAPYLTPQMMQAMSTGNPVWPATMVVEDAPMQAIADGFVLTHTMR